MTMVHNFRFAFVVSAFLVAQRAPAKQVILTVRNEPEVYTLTFDDAIISEGRIKAILPLSPHPLYSDIKVAPSLELCIDGDSRYAPCGPLNPKTGLRDLDDPNFMKNARLNLNAGKEQMAQLESLRYPRELAPAWNYVKGYLSLTLWLAQTQYDFYRTWDTGILRSKHDDFDPSQSCSSEIARIDAAESKAEKHRLAAQGWYNCVLDNFIEQHRLQYPVDSWKRFLETYGIKTKYEIDLD